MGARQHSRILLSPYNLCSSPSLATLRTSENLGCEMGETCCDGSIRRRYIVCQASTNAATIASSPCDCSLSITYPRTAEVIMSMASSRASSRKDTRTSCVAASGTAALLFSQVVEHNAWRRSPSQEPRTHGAERPAHCRTTLEGEVRVTRPSVGAQANSC